MTEAEMSQTPQPESAPATLTDQGLEYVGVSRIDGPLLLVETRHAVGFDEVVEITDPAGNRRVGRVLDTTDSQRGGAGPRRDHRAEQPADARCASWENRCTWTSRGPCSGASSTAWGGPTDGGPEPIGGVRRDINGEPLNPYSRVYPRDFIQTGISAIDGMNTLVRGQKLPVFSGNGLPHNQIAAQIARQAKLVGEEVEFAVIFAGMGVKHDVAQYFVKNFEDSGALSNVAMFLSLADAPSVERLLTPALGAHAGGAPGVRHRHAHPGDPDRHDQLLRIAARSGHRPRRDPRAKGLSRLPLQRPGLDLRARRAHQGQRRAPSRRCRS